MRWTIFSKPAANGLPVLIEAPPHAEALAPSLDIADVVVFLARPELPWDAGKVVAAVRGDARTVADGGTLIAALKDIARSGDHVVFMSNGGFDGAPRRFHAALQDG